MPAEVKAAVDRLRGWCGQGASAPISEEPCALDAATYNAKLMDPTSPAAKQVRFKFSKAYGEIEGINLYGRKTGDTTWVNLGRFNATPANAKLPLANGNPEDWQFQARAVKDDIEIGHPSPSMSVIVRS